MNKLGWFHFLILEGGLLLTLIDCIFLSPFLDVTRFSMSTVSFLTQLDYYIFAALHLQYSRVVLILTQNTINTTKKKVKFWSPHSSKLLFLPHENPPHRFLTAKTSATGVSFYVYTIFSRDPIGSNKPFTYPDRDISWENSCYRF